MTENVRTRLRDLDVDVVRVPVELEMAQLLQHEPEAHRARAATTVHIERSKIRRELLAYTLYLSKEMAPAVHATAHEALRVLDIDRPVELFQSTSMAPGEINAQIDFYNIGTDDAVFIIVEGHVLTKLSQDQILYVLGHELGHYLAHGPQTALPISLREAREIAHATPREHIRRRAMSLLMAAELTADRFGLLTCQDLEAPLRAGMVDASGLAETDLSWDTRAYLNQCRELMEETLAAGESAMGTAHPEHNLRTYAAWLFSETRTYRELTGKGPGTRSVGEVDATLSKLLVPEPEPPRAPRSRPFAPPPRQHRGFGGGAAGPPRAMPDPNAMGSDLEGDGRAGAVLAGAIKGASRGLSRIKKATGAGVAKMVGRSYHDTSDDLTADDDFEWEDPDEKDLLDRFAELERKLKEKGEL